MSKNHKPKIWSEMANKSKEELWLDEQDRKEKIADLQREAEKADAIKLKTMIDAIASLQALFASVDMQSARGNAGKDWLKGRMQSASNGCLSMYDKLKGEE